MKRIVAVKLLSQSLLSSSDAVQRFYREIEAVAKLSHPNIVTAFDAGQRNGQHCLVMEYVDGADLSDVVKVNGSNPAANYGTSFQSER
jgi:serine/threonine protein kinase